MNNSRVSQESKRLIIKCPVCGQRGSVKTMKQAKFWKQNHEIICKFARKKN